jgi:Ca2+/Na+ antiporter
MDHVFFDFVIIAFPLCTLCNLLGVQPIVIRSTAPESRRVQCVVALFVSFFVALLVLMGLRNGAGEQAGATARLVATSADQNDFKQAKMLFRKIVIPIAMPWLVALGGLPM